MQNLYKEVKDYYKYIVKNFMSNLLFKLIDHKLVRILLIIIMVAVIFYDQHYIVRSNEEISELNKLFDSVTLEVIIGFSVITVAIIMPLIVLMISFYLKENNKTVLDRQVSLNELDILSQLKILLFKIMIPLLFWNRFEDALIFKFLVLIYFLSGIVKLIEILTLNYKWTISVDTIEEYANERRFHFLENILNHQKKDTWSEIWEDKRTRRIMGDYKLIPLFVKQVELLSKGNIDDIKDGKSMIEDFILKLKRENSFGVLGILKQGSSFINLDINLRNPIILESLMFLSIRNIDKLEANQDKDTKSYFKALESLFIKIIQSSVIDSELFPAFFEEIQNILKKEPKSRRERLMNNIAYIFLQNMVNSGQSYKDYVWESFPATWKITLNNSKNQTMSKAWVFQYKEIIIKWIKDVYKDYQSAPFDIYTFMEDINRFLSDENEINPYAWSLLCMLEDALQSDTDKPRNTDDKIEKQIEKFTEIYSNFCEKTKRLNKEIKENENKNIFIINKNINVFPKFKKEVNINKYLKLLKKREQYHIGFIGHYPIKEAISMLNVFKKCLSESKNNNK